MAAGDSISDAAGEEEEDEKEDESKMCTSAPWILRRNSFLDSISLSPPPSDTRPLVSIKDKHHEEEDDSSFIIFPPTHHENLHLSPPPPSAALDFKYHGEPLTLPFLSSSCSSSSEIVDEDESNDDSSTSTLFSPSTGPDSPPAPRAREMVGVARWVSLGTEVLYSKVKRVLLLASELFRVKKSAVTLVAMVVGFLYIWWRRRRGKIEQECRYRVVRIIEEKDERINQLLNQIARMNDLLLALQRLPAPSKDTK